MFPIASHLVFETSNNGSNKFHSKIVENDRNHRHTQFEIESILRSSPSNNNSDICVTADEFIAKNSGSHQFSFDQVQIDNNSPKVFSIIPHTIEGIMIPQEPMLRNKFWIKNIKIADNIPSANVMLHFNEDRVELKAIKSINSNDELLMWFSEEVISFMGIPFLIPGNIQARNCDQFDENIIWKRLQAELLSRHQRKLMIHSRNFDQIFNPFHHHHHGFIHGNPQLLLQQSSTSTAATNHHRFSAFQPVQLKTSPRSSPTSAVIPLMPQSSSVNDSALAAAAHLETIVSNMGTSKQGHLCIYCGKLYSRKYGLKIHIRTHTGFKPLKCKFCFRPFGDPSNLNKHIRLHTQHSNDHSTSSENSSSSSSAHHCHICNKNFLKQRDLQRHVQLKHADVLIVNGNPATPQEDSQDLTLLSSPASSGSSNDDICEDDEDEETDVVD
ncbi:unnamed protein product [Chironomus riparius]|uniref:C2H2-type domain-containing protein n=1 Tax=Chironomus riparius TaxID=315576 RepID=A0A9N9RQG7_9DIPT|nr:unnamed protein product [Chironomus riparius]